MYKIAILLSTYNGEKYLNNLLKSLKSQRKVLLKIYVLDDSSNDNTISILKNSDLDLEILSSSGFRDPSKNFFYLLKNVPINFDYYCFCDQDDVWLKNKIIYSIYKLKSENADILGSRTYYTDKNLKIYGTSLFFKKKLSLENSLVQSITGGNTQIWTQNFHNKISKLCLTSPASHDWMLYQIAMLTNSKFVYLKKPLVLYRQHENNKIGANTGMVNLIKRIHWGLRGNFKKSHNKNKDHLFDAISILDVPERNKQIIKFFYEAIEDNFFFKFYKLLFVLKIYRQTLKGNLMLLLAILLNKI